MFRCHTNHGTFSRVQVCKSVVVVSAVWSAGLYFWTTRWAGPSASCSSGGRVKVFMSCPRSSCNILLYSNHTASLCVLQLPRIDLTFYPSHFGLTKTMDSVQEHGHRSLSCFVCMSMRPSKRYFKDLVGGCLVSRCIPELRASFYGHN